MGQEKIMKTVSITPTDRGISLDLGEDGMNFKDLASLMDAIGLGSAIEELKRVVPFMEVEQ